MAVLYVPDRQDLRALARDCQILSCAARSRSRAVRRRQQCDRQQCVFDAREYPAQVAAGTVSNINDEMSVWDEVVMKQEMRMVIHS